MLKTLLIVACLAGAVAAQEVDANGNYLLNESPVKGKVQMSLQAPGGLWRVQSESLEARQSPDPNSKVVRTFKRGDVIQADAGTGGSDEGIQNPKDAKGNRWMGCRDQAGKSLDCWVPANTKTLSPIKSQSELSAAPKPSSPAAKKAMTRPAKAMADIPDSARSDGNGTSSLRPYVIQIESMMRWEAMDDGWAKRRDAWAQEVLKASKVSTLDGLVAELEASTKWDAVNDGWDKSREAWTKKVSAAGSRKALGDLLQQFENALKWEYMQSDWKGARDGWVENVVNAER